jgi:hypothetical protein
VLVLVLLVEQVVLLARVVQHIQPQEVVAQEDILLLEASVALLLELGLR